MTNGQGRRQGRKESQPWEGGPHGRCLRSRCFRPRTISRHRSTHCFRTNLAHLLPEGSRFRPGLCGARTRSQRSTSRTLILPGSSATSNSSRPPAPPNPQHLGPFTTRLFKAHSSSFPPLHHRHPQGSSDLSPGLHSLCYTSRTTNL